MIASIARQTLRALLRRPLSQLITVALIGASASLLAVSLTVSLNLERLSARWEEGGELLAVLAPALPDATYEDIAARARSLPGVREVTLRPPSMAQRDILDTLGADTFEVGAALSALPGTLEVALSKTSAVDLSALRARLVDLDGVQEVTSLAEGEGLIAQLYALRRALKGWLWVLGVWVGVSVAFVVAQLVRLSLLQRRLEIEVWVAVGASEGFILAPLLAEAAAQTALGAWLSLSLVDRLVSALRVGSERTLGLLQIELVTLSAAQVAMCVAGAALIGVAASWRVARAQLRGR
jgi:cell division transport system permease protein